MGLFFSNIWFFNDIISIPKKVDHSKPKKEKFLEITGLLNELNASLPSFIFIPSDGEYNCDFRSVAPEINHC